MLRFAVFILFAPALLFADRPINVPFLQKAPTIDGDLSEWKDVAHNDGLWDMRRIAETSFYALDRGARNRLTDHGNEAHISEDLSARYYIAWDKKIYTSGPRCTTISMTVTTPNQPTSAGILTMLSAGL